MGGDKETKRERKGGPTNMTNVNHPLRGNVNRLGWCLWLDDLRDPPVEEEGGGWSFPEGGCTQAWTVARTSEEALSLCESLGFPAYMSLDHDLGGEDTTMVFLGRLVRELWDTKSLPPDYRVHSANPVGARNIVSFMESWKRSLVSE